MTLSIQFTTMAMMVLSGIYLGLIQDTFRRFAIHWEKKKALSYLIEISFWILQTLIVFYVLFRVNAGELRLYVFLACLLGFSAYQALLKKGYKLVLERVINVGTRILGVFQRVISILLITPLKWVFLLCVTLLLFLFRMVTNVLVFILKLLFFPIRLLGKIIQPLIPEKIIRFFHKFIMFYSTIKHRAKKWLKYMTFRRR